MTREERNKFVEENLGLVHYWLKKYQDCSNYEDLVGYGIIGMIDALDRMEGEIINSGYLKRYVVGYVTRLNIKNEEPIYKVNPGKGIYEKVDYCSLDLPVGEDGKNDCLGDFITDEKQTYNDVITYCDFENELNRVCNKHKEEMMLFLEGYSRTEIAKEIGLSYEGLRQQILKLDKKNFS